MPLRTPLCDLLGIDVPIIQAGMSVLTSPSLVAAVSNAGGLGTLGGWRRSADDLVNAMSAVRELTSKPFAVNHLVPDLDAEGWKATLAAKPAVVSLALGDPGDLVAQAHDVGALVVHQVTTVAQASEAAERGVDVIIAQGWEAGGFGGEVATMPLVPQVVDAVGATPVVASGGIADGRGLAAALILGAAGVSLGTRFLASIEAPIATGWKQRLVESSSEVAVKFTTLNDINPMPGKMGYGTSVRALRTPFTDEWEGRSEAARANATELQSQLRTAGQEGRTHELLAGAGQSTGLVHEVLSVQTIIDRLFAEAVEAMRRQSLN